MNPSRFLRLALLPLAALILCQAAPVATTNAFTAFTTSTFTATGTSATLTFTGIAQGDVAIDKVSVGP